MLDNGDLVSGRTIKIWSVEAGTVKLTGKNVVFALKQLENEDFVSGSEDGLGC